eukprot:SAG11_NODE_36711_length_260_cov_0.670807_1_plen_62_part_01
MTSGLRIEITLEEAKKCIRNLKTTTAQHYVPYVYGKSHSDDKLDSTDKTSTIALSKLKNNMV